MVAGFEDEETNPNGAERVTIITYLYTRYITGTVGTLVTDALEFKGIRAPGLPE